MREFSVPSLQVFEGGWGCKTELVLSGCQICTSVEDHCQLVDDMCQHITGAPVFCCWWVILFNKHILITCACRCFCVLQVHQVENWHVGIAPQRSLSSYSTLTVARCVWLLHHASNRHGGPIYYKLQRNIRARVHLSSRCTRFKAFFEVILFVVYWLDICYLPPASTLVWGFTRIQGLFWCCVYFEEAQRKVSGTRTSNGQRGRGEISYLVSASSYYNRVFPRS